METMDLIKDIEKLLKKYSEKTKLIVSDIDLIYFYDKVEDCNYRIKLTIKNI